MPFRWYSIIRRGDLSTAKVWQHDKLTRGALSALKITVEAQNGGSYNLDNPIYENVKAIRLIDGSYIALSLPGPIGRAITCLYTGNIQDTKWSEQASGWQGDTWIPQFGDFLGDPNKYVQLSEMANPMIEVDWDEAYVKDAGATGILSDSGRINVHALIDPENTSRAPGGFNRMREIKKFTSAGSGEEPVTIDVDFPVRGLFLRSKKNDSGPDEGISQVKLSFDADAYVPILEYSEDAMYRNPSEFQIPRSFGNRVMAKHDIDIHAPFSWVQSVNLMPHGGAARHAYVNYAIPLTARLAYFDTSDVAITAYEQVLAQWFGFGNYSTIGWRWGGVPWAPAPLAANRYSKGTFTLTQAEASHAVSVALEQVAVQPAKPA
jgi:hypothetical protein